MVVRSACFALLLAAPLFPPSVAHAQGIPAEAYHAKTVFIRNNAGGAPLENAADEELSKWGRFTLADDEASADIILVFSKRRHHEHGEEREQEGRHLLRHKLWRQLLARRDGARVHEGPRARAGVAALLAKRLRRHEPESHGQRLHRRFQEAVSAIGRMLFSHFMLALMLAIAVTALGVVLHRYRRNQREQAGFDGLEYDSRKIDDIPDVNYGLRSYLTTDRIATLDISMIAAFWYAGEIANNRIPEVAAKLLERGISNVHLGLIAGMTNPKITRSEIDEDLDRAFRELGVNAPMSRSAAQLIAGLHLARKISDAQIDAARGASLITELFDWDADGPAGQIVRIHSDLVSRVRRNSPEEHAAKDTAVAACREFLTATERPN